MDMDQEADLQEDPFARMMETIRAYDAAARRDPSYGKVILSPSQAAHLRRLRGYTPDMEQHVYVLGSGPLPPITCCGHEGEHEREGPIFGCEYHGCPPTRT
jgi:hypothetical protein